MSKTRTSSLFGTLKRPNAKGFVFVKMDGSSEELFCHASRMVDVDFTALVGGERVSIEQVITTDRGPACAGVRLL